MKRDGDYIRDDKGAIMAQAWPCVSRPKRRKLLNVMAAAPELLATLRAMREELDAMSGYWTERMDTLAQAADSVLAAARPHPGLSHGDCDICNHTGSDCTGAR